MDSLLKIAEQENIAINYADILDRFKVLGLYDNDGRNAQIILHSGLKNDPRLLRCIFAEELGHHFTSAGPSFYKTINFQFWKLTHKKIENKAITWSAYFFVPAAFLLRLVASGLQTSRELAELCEITPELAQFRLILHQTKPPAKETRKDLFALREAHGQLRLFD